MTQETAQRPVLATASTYDGPFRGGRFTECSACSGRTPSCTRSLRSRPQGECEWKLSERRFCNVGPSWPPRRPCRESLLMEDKGGNKTGPNPTDKGKAGTKRLALWSTAGASRS